MILIRCINLTELLEELPRILQQIGSCSIYLSPFYWLALALSWIKMEGKTWLQPSTWIRWSSLQMCDCLIYFILAIFSDFIIINIWKLYNLLVSTLSMHSYTDKNSCCWACSRLPEAMVHRMLINDTFKRWASPVGSPI